MAALQPLRRRAVLGEEVFKLDSLGLPEGVSKSTRMLVLDDRAVLPMLY